MFQLVLSKLCAEAPFTGRATFLALHTKSDGSTDNRNIQEYVVDGATVALHAPEERVITIRALTFGR